MPDLLLNVFFEGTDGHLDSKDSLTSLLFSKALADNKHSFKIGFNGCGTDNEQSRTYDFGGIFSYGLATQVNLVVARIRELLNSTEDAHLTVNTYGFSRGGAATFLLANKMQSLPLEIQKRVTINIATLEPVPGNLPATVALDIIGHSLTSQVGDISTCPVKNLLVLYTNKLFPTFDSLSKIVADAHAPILPSYPLNCQVEIDVMQGCHKTAQFLLTSTNAIKFQSANALLTFFRVKQFFEQLGTQFDLDNYQFQLHSHCYPETNDTMIALYERILHKEHTNSTIYRPMHKDNKILTHYSREKKYLNLHHKKLCLSNNNNIDPLDVGDIALMVVETEPERPGYCLVM